MKNYYYLATALPDLEVGTQPEIEFPEFDWMLKQNLTRSDLVKTKVWQRYYDIQNIRYLWQGAELDPRGSLDENQLEEALIFREGLPRYVYDFMDRYETSKERLDHFPALVGMYFSGEIAQAQGFLKEYLTFEREWRLVLTGFRAKKLGRDILAELQYENPEDELVAQIIAQKDSKTYEPPEKFADLKALFEEFGDSPLELAKALSAYRFAKIDEMLGIAPFSFDRITGYFAQLLIVENWLKLDQEKGKEIVETIVKEPT